MKKTEYNIKRFVGYRPNITPDTHSDDMMNSPDEIQFEGVVLSTGKTFIQWRTNVESTSLFDTYEQFLLIHGHPEYGSKIVFLDEDNVRPEEPVMPENDQNIGIWMMKKWLTLAVSQGE